MTNWATVVDVNWSLCETVHGISIHIRRLEKGEKPCYTGTKGKHMTLCGFPVGWDLPGDPKLAMCRRCLPKYMEETAS